MRRGRWSAWGSVAGWMLALAGLTGGAFAHEFWIFPGTFRPKSGEVVKVELHNGHGFPGEKVQRDNARIELFSVFAPGASSPAPIAGRDGDTTAGLVRPDADGAHVLAYRNTPKLIELPAEKFDSYLREEGLDSIVEERRKLGESQKPGRELFSRAAKAIVHAGASASEASSRRATTPVGLTLELTPSVDPAVIKPGEEVEFTLAYEGKPLAGALVGAHTPADSGMHPTGRTDERGKVRLKLDKPGMWLIAAVQMTRAAPGSGAEWQSVWASLTFEIRGG